MRLSAVLKGVAGLNFGKFEDNHMIYLVMLMSFLFQTMQQNAGKSGGEFLRPQSVSKLIAQLAMHKQKQ